MTDPREPLYSPLAIASGVGIAAAAIVLLLLMMRFTIGPFALFDGGEDRTQISFDFGIVAPVDRAVDLRASARAIGAQRIEVSVSNTSDEALEGAVVRIALPAEADIPRVSVARFRQRTADLVGAPAPGPGRRAFDLRLPRLGGRETLTYFLDLAR